MKLIPIEFAITTNSSGEALYDVCGTGKTTTVGYLLTVQPQA